MSVIVFLQAAVQTLSDSSIVTEPTKENLWSLLARGGVIMIPLGLLLCIGVYIFIERFLVIRSALKSSRSFATMITSQSSTNTIDNVVMYCKAQSHLLSRLLLKGLDKRNKPTEIIEKSLYATAKIELFHLERRVSILSIIGYIAPLFGFLGTIIGMFDLFYTIASTGEYTIASIAGGIYIKMISSAAGLIIGLAAYIVYRILEGMLDAIENRMEQAITEFIDILYDLHPHH